MWDTQYLRLVNNVDPQARSAKLHIFFYCDIKLKCKNSKFGGNGDHTSDTAGAHMLAYKSVKHYLQLTLVNQKRGGDLQILITEVINYSQIYEMTLKSLWEQSSPGWMLETKVLFPYCAALTINDVMAGI